MSRFTNIISLGGFCAPAWQIRHFLKDDTAYPFDWTILPFNSLINIIENDFNAFCQADSYSLGRNPAFIVNTRYPLAHVHDFPNPSANGSWKELIPTVSSKYKFLVDRFLRAVNGPGKILFVRQQAHIDDKDFKHVDHLSTADAEKLSLVLQEKYKNLDFEILFVNALFSPTQNVRIKSAELSWDVQADWPDESDHWKGPTREWQALLQKTCATI